MDCLNDSPEPTSSRQHCLQVLSTFIPRNAKEEFYQLTRLAVPMFASQLMVFLISFVSTVFCGHLGKTELDAVALSITVINVTGISIGSGLASVCDTLISQTYGSGNLKRVGIILQRGILILMLSCFPCWAFLINTESLLRLAQQNPEVIRLTQMYVKIFMPSLPAVFLYQLQGRYLQNQGIIWPQVITGVAGNIVNALINYIFLFVLNLGVAGSAWANTISQFSLAVFLYSYIRWKNLHVETWSGWSQECLQEWGSFMRLAIPSMLMLCIEWWTFEIGSFLSGLISKVALGSQSILYELSTIAFMFPLGYGVAVNVRVGNALGAGKTEQAKKSCKVAVMCTGVLAILVMSVVLALKNKIAYIFTTDPEIIDLVSSIIVIFGPCHLCDAFQCVFSGIVKGAGKQKIGAICNLTGYYIIGLPIGISLMFAAHMGVLGFWIGLLVCVFMQCIFFLILVLKFDWKLVTEEAQMRAGLKKSSSNENSNLQAKNVHPTNNSAEVNHHSWPHVVLDDFIAEQSHTDTEELVEDDEKSGRGVENVSENPLTFRQLVLYRGLTLAACFFILAVGILIDLLLSHN
ncbi:multidrug and toxin extrusion protein 1-like isoform X1 [Polypterus senegalus]|uniref:multidrug and toxin extrusion protein 1-like isoform X1 n=2 Tax=Polypterus senegalus TaxID=55291 RepID=UPI0019650F37|nr:multidrug and toxin extrusion protein 1-like isoform X1 [Polypterus senegalus]